MTFESLFQQATGREPYPYQSRFAAVQTLPELLSVPTREPQGVSPRSQTVQNGRGHPLLALASPPWAPPELQASTPRRLVYCLPMRTLVDQTATATQTWLSQLKERRLNVPMLMGGKQTCEPRPNVSLPAHLTLGRA